MDLRGYTLHVIIVLLLLLYKLLNIVLILYVIVSFLYSTYIEINCRTVFIHPQLLLIKEALGVCLSAH